MKKVFNNIIPFNGFMAITIWPFLFIRKTAAQYFDGIAARHENIHGEQQKEMLGVGAMLTAVLIILGYGCWSLLALPIFFWWYGIEWLVRFVQYRNFNTAYKNIAFEREAYDRQSDAAYLDRRKPFAWVPYL